MTAKKPSTRRNKAGTSKQAAEERKRLFADAYIANGGNKTQAAVAAGYTPGRASEQAGCRLSKNVVVQRMISERAKATADKYELTAELAARSIVQELTFDPAKLYREDGSLKAITELDEDTRMALTAVEFEQHGSPDAPVFVRKVKWANRSSAREHLMKHRGMFEQDNRQRVGLLGDVPRDVLKAIIEGIKRIDG